MSIGGRGDGRRGADRKLWGAPNRGHNERAFVGRPVDDDRAAGCDHDDHVGHCRSGVNDCGAPTNLPGCDRWRS